MTLTEHIQPLLDKRLPAALVAAALLSATGAYAQTYLQSDAPKYDFDIVYQEDIQTVFHEAYADDVLLRMIAEPSFFREFAVGLKKTASGTSIFGLRAKVQIWTFESRDSLMMEARDCVSSPHEGCRELQSESTDMPDDIHGIGLERCEILLPEATVPKIEDAWHLALLTVGSRTDEVVGVDGESFYFGAREDGQWRGGKVWSPDPNTLPGRLVSLALDMNDLCHGQNGATAAKIDLEASELVGELKAQQ
ncbi:MAG TPA: hypothetical protein VG819_10175 [Rhizomicrobium sp.]|nr:hypothetical protein [Rhizomicrobium sp.]